MPSRKFALLIILLVLSMLLVACGESTSYNSTAAESVGKAAPAPAANGAGAVEAAPGNAKQAVTDDRKIIRNATIAIVVGTMEDGLARLRAIAVNSGGLVFSENSTQSNDLPRATLVMQVPSANYEDAITKIRTTAVRVTSEESSAQDVSEEYTDLTAQIANLKTSEDGIKKLMDKAQKLEDIVTLQRELTTVRGQIEKLQGRLNFLEKHTSYSTITVNLSLPYIPAKISEPDSSVLGVVGQSWQASLNFLKGVA